MRRQGQHSATPSRSLGFYLLALALGIAFAAKLYRFFSAAGVDRGGRLLPFGDRSPAVGVLGIGGDGAEEDGERRRRSKASAGKAGVGGVSRGGVEGMAF